MKPVTSDSEGDIITSQNSKSESGEWESGYLPPDKKPWKCGVLGCQVQGYSSVDNLQRHYRVQHLISGGPEYPTAKTLGTSPPQVSVLSAPSSPGVYYDTSSPQPKSPQAFLFSPIQSMDTPLPISNKPLEAVCNMQERERSEMITVLGSSEETVKIVRPGPDGEEVLASSGETVKIMIRSRPSTPVIERRRSRITL